MPLPPTLRNQLIDSQKAFLKIYDAVLRDSNLLHKDGSQSLSLLGLAKVTWNSKMIDAFLDPVNTMIQNAHPQNKYMLKARNKLAANALIKDFSKEPRFNDLIEAFTNLSAAAITYNNNLTRQYRQSKQIRAAEAETKSLEEVRNELASQYHELMK